MENEKGLPKGQVDLHMQGDVDSFTQKYAPALKELDLQDDEQVRNFLFSIWRLGNEQYRKGKEFIEENHLNASEAMYGFAGWLTTRDEVSILSAKHEASFIVPLLEEFRERCSLPPVREDWTKNLPPLHHE